MSLEEFSDWYDKQEKRCVYCGVTVDILKNKYDSILTNRVLSIDRIDAKKGYSLDNIVLACVRCNLIKNDFFTFKEMMEIGEKYVKPRWRD